MSETEGVIKFELTFYKGPSLSTARLRDLIAWHQICHRLELIGQDPQRYDGYAYGNISKRLDARTFAISGTQTGGKPTLSAADYARVTTWDIRANRVTADGPVRPSSESLTHSVLYEFSPEINFIIHGHTPIIWRQAEQLGLPVTDPAAAYGTPAIAEAVSQLLVDDRLGTTGVFTMGGHEDGVIAYGADATGAGQALIGVLALALANDMARHD